MSDQESLILLVTPPGPEGEFDQTFMERSGHHVVVCHGPEPATLCPLLAGDGCEMVDDAHGIVFELDLDRPQHRAILHRYRQVVRPDVPIRAIVRPGQDIRYADQLAGVEVWAREPSVAELDGFVAEVEGADRAGL